MDTKSRALSLLLVLVAFSFGCVEKPVISSVGKAAVAGGVQFDVSDYDVRYLEVSDGKETYAYPRPVLAIPVTITNQDAKGLMYSPTHSQQQMSEGTTPLLYQDPGAEADLPPESKVNINGVYLEQGHAKGQLQSPSTIEKGESASDIFLFEVPDGAQELILSIPPSMHRGKMPVLFRVSYQPMEPKGPKVNKVGEASDFDGVKFTVTGTSIEYVKIDDLAKGKGYAADPLLKVSYTVENGGKEPVDFEPGHKSKSTKGAVLFTQAGALGRVNFSANTRVPGQLQKGATVEPGSKAEDFVLFPLPKKREKAVSFEMPASTFGKPGVVRFNIPFEYKLPKKPKGVK